MSGDVIDLNPVSRITIGTVGAPGQRVFLLQAQQERSPLTLKIEKEQARVLATSLDEFLDEINDKYPRPYASFDRPLGSDLLLHDPIEPEFVVGQIGLGYDEGDDMIVLVVQEIQAEEQFTKPRTARFWATRGQMQALSDHTLNIVNQGRPICPLCNGPKSETGQFCPRSNGHETLGNMPCQTV